MSLVEQALRRMRQSGRGGMATAVPAGSLRTAEPFARLVSIPRDVTAPDAPWPPPGRVIAVNQAGLRAAGLLPPEHQERQLAQQYRQIKRPLVASALGKGVPQIPNGHLIMVASALPGEGKTFMSINLAFSLAAERDLRILLVDADVAKPHISRLFGLDDEPGLLDALRDESIEIESLVIPTEIPGLFVLPAGRPTEHATELLASARMDALTRDIGHRDPSRVVLFDSPPLLMTTESQVLAQAVGQIVVVVRAGKTTQQELESALSFLADRPAVSLVLNQSVSADRSGYYYHGYGYGYGQQRDAANLGPQLPV